MTPSHFWRALPLLGVVGALPAQEAKPAEHEPAPEREQGPGMGPSSTPAQLQEDAKPREPVFRFTGLQTLLQPYFDFKKQLSEDHGLTFGLDYSALYQRLSESLGEDQAATGIFRVYGTWDLFGRESGNTGSIVAKVENRHKLGTNVNNQFLGFEAGYQGLVGAQFRDFGWGLTNLYWKQRLGGGRFAFVVGQVDTTDYFDVYGMANPLTAFLNFDFLYPTAAPPNQGLGVAASAWLTDNIYAIAGVADANGEPTEAGFDSFFNTREYFTHAEVGWSTARDRFIFDNIHVTAWHSDAREQANTPESWGVLVSGSYFVNDTWMPFLRAGWSDGQAPLLNASVAAGVGHYVRQRGDLLGFAASWGQPAASGLGDQFSSELFYRLQFSPNFALTPDLQLLVNPAANPVDDVVWVLGIRGRLVF